jgi:hypothetical protein
MSEGGVSWREMDPWEKARRWQKVSPEMTRELVKQAAAHTDQLMKLEAERTRHALRLAEKNAQHLREMDVRRFRLQLIGTVGGLICIIGLILVAWLYADTGNIVPGLAIFGLGSGLTAGIYGLQWSAARDAKALTQQVRALNSLAANQPAAPVAEGPAAV